MMTRPVGRPLCVRILTWVLGWAVLWMGLGFLGAYAEQRLTRLDSPLTVQLKNGLTPTENQTFDSVLTERYVYKQQILPAGTILRGRVAKVQNPRYLKRSGYVVLSVDEAVFPSGEGVRFIVGQPPHGEYTQKLKGKKKGGGSFKREFFRYNLPIMVVSLSVSLPLHLFTDLPFYVVTPINYGARAVTATTLEFIYDDHQGAGKKILWGLYRASGIPGFLFFVKKGASVPSFRAGQNVVIEIHPDGMAKLFGAANGDILPLPPQSVFGGQ